MTASPTAVSSSAETGQYSHVRISRIRPFVTLRSLTHSHSCTHALTHIHMHIHSHSHMHARTLTHTGSRPRGVVRPAGQVKVACGLQQARAWRGRQPRSRWDSHRCSAPCYLGDRKGTVTGPVGFKAP